MRWNSIKSATMPNFNFDFRFFVVLFTSFQFKCDKWQGAKSTEHRARSTQIAEPETSANGQEIASDSRRSPEHRGINRGMDGRSRGPKIMGTRRTRIQDQIDVDVWSERVARSRPGLWGVVRLAIKLQNNNFYYQLDDGDDDDRCGRLPICGLKWNGNQLQWNTGA